MKVNIASRKADQLTAHNVLMQFLFLDCKKHFKKKPLILSCEISQCLLSEFSKVRKELPARYVFLIADYLIKFRLKVLLLQDHSAAL